MYVSTLLVNYASTTGFFSSFFQFLNMIHYGTVLYELSSKRGYGRKKEIYLGLGFSSGDHDCPGPIILLYTELKRKLWEIAKRVKHSTVFLPTFFYLL